MVALRATLAGEVVTDDETVVLDIANPFCVTESHNAYKDHLPETFQERVVTAGAPAEIAHDPFPERGR